MDIQHPSAGGPATIIPFPKPRQAGHQSVSKQDRDKAILEHYRRRLDFERKTRSGSLTDAEEISGDMGLRAEVFAIARKFGL